MIGNYRVYDADAHVILAPVHPIRGPDKWPGVFSGSMLCCGQIFSNSLCPIR